MCPACIASATLMAGGVITTGGVTALVDRVLHTRKIARTSDSSNSNERRNDHGYNDEQHGNLQSGTPS
jgi:hypothetical protein